MCGGPEPVHRPRGGALVALNPPRGTSSPAAMTGNLTFHTPGQPDSMEATHARLAFDDQIQASLSSNLHVIIQCVDARAPPKRRRPSPTASSLANIAGADSTGGDLTKRASDCGLFRRLRLSARDTAAGGAFWEWPLSQSLSLQVGSDGIIGRRVSVYADEGRETDGAVLAEGIVGFNSWAAERASL